MQSLKQGKGIATAALTAGMSENTARRYRKSGSLPSGVHPAHEWRTRADPLGVVWPEIREMLMEHPGLQGKTIFDELQRRYPEQFASGQLRTLQRRIKQWAATEGPGKAVMFPQIHYPGQVAASDFCHFSRLNITLSGQPFPHLLYHFVLTYSNWETGRVCFSESFESLSEGLQAALTTLGGVPQRHRTDCLSAAVYRIGSAGSVAAGGSSAGGIGREQGFTAAYQALLAHFGLTGEHIQAGQANENGDIEQRHYRFRTAVEQALMLRGSRDFANREEYEAFIERQFALLNATRQARFQEEVPVLRSLPAVSLHASTAFEVRVGPSSTIRVKNNTYSVPSRLIGEAVQVRLYSQEVEVWYGQQLQARIPRLRGGGGHSINYRHIIDSLVRKPGAFAQYRFRADLFPCSAFRTAYDTLCAGAANPHRADKEYLAILHLAAHCGEQSVVDVLRLLLLSGDAISAVAVQSFLDNDTRIPLRTDVTVQPVCLEAYDQLLQCAAQLAVQEVLR